MRSHTTAFHQKFSFCFWTHSIQHIFPPSHWEMSCQKLSVTSILFIPMVNFYIIVYLVLLYLTFHQHVAQLITLYFETFSLIPFQHIIFSVFLLRLWLILSCLLCSFFFISPNSEHWINEGSILRSSDFSIFTTFLSDLIQAYGFVRHHSGIESFLYILISSPSELHIDKFNLSLNTSTWMFYWHIKLNRSKIKLQIFLWLFSQPSPSQLRKTVFLHCLNPKSRVILNFCVPQTSYLIITKYCHLSLKIYPESEHFWLATNISAWITEMSSWVLSLPLSLLFYGRFSIWQKN